MAKAKTSKEKQEELLLAYIDIPYFRNNPTYIARWRDYYQRYKDPQVLLLMYHKQISTYYHWLYIELSQHFLKKGEVQLACFVLNEAIRNNVYDSTKITQAIKQIPTFEKKYTKGDMLALLHSKNIKALGRIWNGSQEVHFYVDKLKEGAVNFEIQKIQEHENRYCKKTQNLEDCTMDGENWIISSCAGIFKESCELADNEELLRKLSMEEIEQSFNNPQCEEVRAPSPILENSEQFSTQNEPGKCIFSQQTDDNQIPVLNGISLNPSFKEFERKNALKDMFEPVFSQIAGTLEVGHDVSINRYSYMVQAINEDTVSLLKVALSSDATQTMLSKTMCLKKTTQSACKVLKSLFDFEICQMESYSYYLLMEYEKLCSVKEILKDASETIKAFYLKKILEKLVVLKKENCSISDCLGFFVNQNFEIGFEDVNVQDDPNGIKIECELQQAFPEMNVRIDNQTIKELEEKLSVAQVRREILKHKTDILMSFE